MGRRPCCAKEGLNRGAWTPMEDKILTDYIQTHGQGKWRNLPKKAGLKRCGKSCRLRWLNYLRPDIKRGNITNDEEELIIRLHKLLGNRWSLIAGRLPGRTDNEIKNYWNTIIGKKLQNQETPSSAHNQSNQSNYKKIPYPVVNNSISQNAATDDAAAAATDYSKDSRCSKVTASSEPRNGDDDNTMTEVVAPPSTATSISEGSYNDSMLPESSSVLDFALEEDNNSSDIMLDLGIDEQLLYDLLHADYSELCNLDHGAAASDGDTNVSCDQGQDRSFLVSNSDVMQETAFPSIDSLMASEVAWILD